MCSDPRRPPGTELCAAVLRSPSLRPAPFHRGLETPVPQKPTICLSIGDILSTKMKILRLSNIVRIVQLNKDPLNFRTFRDCRLLDTLMTGAHHFLQIGLQLGLKALHLSHCHHGCCTLSLHRIATLAAFPIHSDAGKGDHALVIQNHGIWRSLQNGQSLLCFRWC